MSASAAFLAGNRFTATLSFVLISLLTTQTVAAPATPVFVQTVEREPLIQTIEALGTLRANESVTLSATVTETISAIHFNDGERVKAGQVLVEMTNTEERARLAEARSNLEEAERQYRRVRSLNNSNLSSESILDERRRAYEIAKAQVQQVESRLQDLQIVAPFDGVVGLRNVSVGTLVRPGDTITTLDDDSVMKLDMSVPSVYLDVLRPGLKVTAKARALNNRAFTGEIASIGTRVDPVTRSVQVRALIANEDRQLKPGLLMRVELQKPAREALVIAEEAVILRGNRAQVFVVDNSTTPATALARQVTLGARQPGVVEVTSGLNEGELVVVHGTMKIRNGSEVRIAAKLTGDENLQELLKQSPASGSAPATNSAAE
jgi:membrane fusion protein (multidrug efflux system)